MIESDMKKITNLLYMLAVLLLASCSDFLDKSPKNTVDPETTVTDDVAIALTNACYRTLQSSNMYNQRIWTLDIVAGNSLVGAGGGTDGLETIQASNFITQSDNGMALYMWRSPWVGIGQCNIVLNSLLEAEAVSEKIKNRCLGEAYFLRAHYYYVLVRLYGGVPLRLAPYNPGEPTDIARATVEETYAQIISDCKNAVDLLPAKSSYDDENVGRACKDAALAMLADIYLTLAPSHTEYYQGMTFLPASMRTISMHWSITGRNLCSRSSIRAIRNMIFGETIRSLPGFLLSWVPVIRTLLPAVMAGTSLQKNLWVNMRAVTNVRI